jgi:hypothetical protein
MFNIFIFELVVLTFKTLQIQICLEIIHINEKYLKQTRRLFKLKNRLKKAENMTNFIWF